MAHRLCTKGQPPQKRRYEYSEKVEQLLNMASSLTAQESLNLVCGLVKRSKMTSANINTLKNYIIPHAKEVKAREQQCIVVSSAPAQGPDQKAETTTQPTTSSSSLSSLSIPHHKVPLIVRADLIQENGELAFDAEKLIQHPKRTDPKFQQVAGDFALVDLQGRVVVWCYIYRENVCMYNTKQTGLDKSKNESGISIATLHTILHHILKKNVLIGAAIKSDFEHLGLEMSRLPGDSTSFDIQTFYKDKNKQAIALSQIGEHMTGQPFQEATHSSLADARMTALAYKRMLKFKEDGIVTFSCPEFDNYREEMQAQKKDGKFKKQWDKCKCFSTKPKFNPPSSWSDPKKLPGI